MECFIQKELTRKNENTFYTHIPKKVLISALLPSEFVKET